ncbi:MAG TPA: hypothetical protein VK054_00765 [Beutenbergiaceae bacterium]|nr:hypothetical protein [Beutenbergiaceae bacterium]
MISPIERAAEALVNAAFGQELPEAPIDLAKAVFDSINTDQLANVLSTLTTCDGQPSASELHRRQAHAVKNWLTGKDQQ